MEQKITLKQLSDKIFELDSDFTDFAMQVFHKLSQFKAKNEEIISKLIDLECSLNNSVSNSQETKSPSDLEAGEQNERFQADKALDTNIHKEIEKEILKDYKKGCGIEWIGFTGLRETCGEGILCEKCRKEDLGVKQ